MEEKLGKQRDYLPRGERTYLGFPLSLLVLLSVFILPISSSRLVLAESTRVLAESAKELDAQTLIELEEITQEISDTTMSPFCPGRTLSACPSDQARQLRIQIMEWLKQGYTPEAVRNNLLMRYGGDVRGTPKPEGFGLMAWIMPVIFVLVCFLLVAFLLRRVRKQEESHDPAELSEAMKSRISDELENRR